MIAGARTFLRDFASYAGRKGFIAVAFVLMSALLEGISLAFLVPLLGIVIGTGVAPGRLERTVSALLQQVFHAVSGLTLEGAAFAAWRNGVSYISQDPFLFHDTVRRNLSWANPHASDQEMWQALTLANAAEVVHRMEHKLDTVLGERGTLVSGGERQRLALARTILRKPRLIVLDEATNAIDVAAEREVLAHLRSLEPLPTIVVIAHRPESLICCDRVIRMEEGRISSTTGDTAD